MSAIRELMNPPIESADGALIGTMAACETIANACERPPTYRTALQAQLIG
jgi:hypothetical protein